MPKKTLPQMTNRALSKLYEECIDSWRKAADSLFKYAAHSDERFSEVKNRLAGDNPDLVAYQKADARRTEIETEISMRIGWERMRSAMTVSDLMNSPRYKREK